MIDLFRFLRHLMPPRLSCIAVHKPKGVTIAEDVLEECFRCNKDGAGFAYVKDGKVVVDKGYFKFKEFYNAIKAVGDTEMLIHCRIQTHGLINEANCHPFGFSPKKHPHFSFAVVHNGILAHRSTNKQSDTSCFVEDVLARQWDRDPYFLFDDGGVGQYLVEKFLGPNNKMIVMRHDARDNTTETVILNEIAGVEDLGCWFSNRSYKKWVYNQATGPYGGQGDYAHWQHGGGAEKHAAPLAVTAGKPDAGLQDRLGYKKNPITKRWEPRNVWEPRMMKEKEEEAEKKSGNPFPKPAEPAPVTVVDFTKADATTQTALAIADSPGTEPPKFDDSEIDLTHLTSKKDRDRLKGIAASWAHALGFERKKMNINQMIRGLRADFVHCVNGGDKVSDVNVDRWLLMNLKGEPETVFDDMKELGVSLKAVHQP